MASDHSVTMADAPPSARRTLARHVLVVQEAERARLARDLHDGVGQTLTAVAINLLALRRDAPTAESQRRLDESLIDGCVNAFEHGLSNETVVASLIASDEYFHLVGSQSN